MCNVNTRLCGGHSAWNSEWGVTSRREGACTQDNVSPGCRHQTHFRSALRIRPAVNLRIRILGSESVKSGPNLGNFEWRTAICSARARGIFSDKPTGGILLHFRAVGIVLLALVAATYTDMAFAANVVISIHVADQMLWVGTLFGDLGAK